MVSLTPKLKKIMERQVSLSKLITGIDYICLTKVLLEYFNKLEIACGSKVAIDELKAVYNESTRYVLEGVISEPLTQKFRKRNKKGFIQSLSLIQNYLDRSTVDEKRMVLSLLRSYESLTIPPIPNLETITKVGVGNNNYITQMSGKFREYLLKGKFPRLIYNSYCMNRDMYMHKNDNDFHYTTKKGIDGAALGNAGLQSLAINGRLKDNLIILSNHYKSNRFEGQLNYNQEFYSNKAKDIGPTKRLDILKTYHVKVTCIPDKGSKNRLIAIGNYWVQNCLRHLHLVTFEVLRSLPTDGTHNQESQFERVKERTSVGPVWSFDLTAATDRFPLQIQIDTLAVMDYKVAKLWSEILSDLRAEYKSKEIVYQVGQPMGLYSSWSTFTLTHHMLIQYIAYEEGKQPENGIFDKYAIIGDDVAIWDKEVALRYTEYIKLLDVQISFKKSYIPKDLEKGPWVAEFAKRVCKSGVEYTGIAPGLVSETTKSFWGYPELFNYLNMHNFGALLCRLTLCDISKHLGLNPKHKEMLGWCFYINHLLGAPYGGNLVSDERYKSVSTAKLYQIRYNTLVEDQVLSLKAPLGLSGKDRDMLAKHFGEETTTSLVVSLVYRTLVWNRIQLASRLKKLHGVTTINLVNKTADIGQPLSVYDKLVSVEVTEAVNNQTTLTLQENLKAIEYIPIIKFSEIMDGVTKHNNKRFYKMKYIEQLVKTIVK